MLKQGASVPEESAGTRDTRAGENEATSEVYREDLDVLVSHRVDPVDAPSPLSLDTGKSNAVTPTLPCDEDNEPENLGRLDPERFDI